MRKAWVLAGKDLKLFFSDVRAAVITVLVPIAIACFMVLIFGGMSKPSDESRKKLDVLLVDLDKSELSTAVAKALGDGSLVAPHEATLVDAKKQVREGKAGVAVVLPAGFGKSAPAAMFYGEKPEIKLYYDPSQSTSVQVVNGAIVQAVMQQVSRSAFSSNNLGSSRESVMSSDMDPAMKSRFGALFDDLEGINGEPGSETAQMQEPFVLSQEALVAEGSDAQEWGATAHIFAGMAVQGVLFFGIEAGMAVMRDRRLGIWRRLKAAPLRNGDIVLGKLVSATLTALFVLFAVFLVGTLLFHYRVTGSWIGFGLVALMTALTTACFGLFLAALGRTEQQSRGFAVLAVLMMSMLGGAWMPSFLMPEWVQRVAMFVPVKWAVDGFDAFLWRGEGLSAVAAPVLGLLAFALVFGGVAMVRFKKLQEA